ncbi:hypothetical protein ABH999_002054 [Bradyrhizobium yuanmingense]|uniref:hypothetical protein n=1 Tax=Bradyrhizobium yuanmingense TaxID=108015 RepID=UPI003517BAD0
MEIAVGANTGIAMCAPGAAECFLRLQDDVARARQLLLDVIGATDAGYAGADDQHVEMFRSLFGRGVTANSDIHCCFYALLVFVAVLDWTARFLRDGHDHPPRLRFKMT